MKSRKAAVKCVIFDAGGVLLTLGGDDYRRELAAVLGIKCLPEGYGDLFPEFQTGHISEDAFWKALAGKPVQMTELDELFRKYHKPVIEMLSLARELKSMGLIIAVLSNTQASHARLMREMGIFAEFHRVFFSCEIGARKPLPQAFDRVTETIGFTPKECIFVDDLQENVEAAASLGFHAILHEGDVMRTRRRIWGLL